MLWIDKEELRVPAFPEARKELLGSQSNMGIILSDWPTSPIGCLSTNAICKPLAMSDTL
jgi:hypothetical protein